ncbi:MAG TPA: RlmE family RNA methyltransferase, partial [Pseudobdellovibrionaceae bacterium]|nr:RlmE family RNA methyltransferase [Pseudobdellovibrionaceae bacterium]
MTYKPHDHYFQKAKKENFAARSVFKLEEIDRRFHIVKPKQVVIDLGASPGSWSQYVSKKVGPEGRVLGIDLKEVTVSLKNATFIKADLRSLELGSSIQSAGFPLHFDLVLSDMAPNTTGIRSADQARSFELCELALSVADQYLRPKGHFVCKLFHSDEFGKLKDMIKQRFERFEAV